jgi:hypothetical protein
MSSLPLSLFVVSRLLISYSESPEEGILENAKKFFFGEAPPASHIVPQRAYRIVAVVARDINSTCNTNTLLWSGRSKRVSDSQHAVAEQVQTCNARTAANL